MFKHSPLKISFSFLILISALCIFLGLGAYQLRLPGLHYDEAREAGLNAMQLVTGQPVTAFRDATVQIGPWRLPLMVQDYIGALNVVLAVPFLAVGGVNVMALRWLPLLTAALTLVVTWRVALRLGGPAAAAATALLMAVNPSFIFWSRQGIYVTNLTALIFAASLLTGLRWWKGRRPRDLWLTAFLWGLGIYAKLLFGWAVMAMLAVAALAWVLEAGGWKLEVGSWKLEVGSWKLETQYAIRNTQYARQPIGRQVLVGALAVAFFLLPLIPLILFNLRTGGTLTTLFGNLGQSYYGVNNSAYLHNLVTRLRQVVTLLRGDQLGYLGEAYANRLAAWSALLLVVLSVLAGWSMWTKRRRSPAAEAQGMPKSAAFPFIGPTLPVLLLALMVAQSAFTVSDLFITHYAMPLPLIPLAGGLAFGAVIAPMTIPLRSSAPPPLRALAVTLAFIALLAWAGGDLWTTIRYHRALAVTGGHGPHSDAIYTLADQLDRGGLAAPVALDWGLDAQIRFLTAGRVQPTEVFGYTGLDVPDAGYPERVSGFLDDPNTIYLAHVPAQTVFRNRVNALAELAWRRGLTLREQVYFNERDGTPLILIYRAGR